MSIQRSIRVSLAGAVALALFGTASIAMAQQMPQPPPPPPPPQQPAAPPPPAAPMPPPSQQQGSPGQFYQGTKSSATYPIQDGTLTVNAGMPDQVRNYGPPPSFKSLDANHDGRISEAEARAYPPLDSDFLYASGEGKSISRAQYEKWVRNQH
ncbi:MAG: EF-hand domain-containing protein [Rhodanobacteraceae bacterium]